MCGDIAAFDVLQPELSNIILLTARGIPAVKGLAQIFILDLLGNLYPFRTAQFFFWCATVLVGQVFRKSWTS